MKSNAESEIIVRCGQQFEDKMAKHKKPINRTGSTKRIVRNKNDNKTNGETLVSMLMKAKVNDVPMPNESTPKRTRIQILALNLIIAWSDSILMNRQATKRQQIWNQAHNRRNPVHSDAVLKWLNYLVHVDQTIDKKVEKAALSRKYASHFRYSNTEIGCGDSTSADWLINNAIEGEPWKGAKLIVSWKNEGPKLVRMAASIPTNNNSDYILNILEGMNKDLNVKEWIIKAKIPAVNRKCTCLIRINEDSAEILKSRNFRVNWLLGSVVIKPKF